MKDPFEHALREVVTLLDSQGLRYALIGGVANQIWGQARFTYGVDAKVLVPDTAHETVRATLTTAFPKPGRPDLPRNPLIVSVKIGELLANYRQIWQRVASSG